MIKDFKKGFTLLELMVVILIVGVLATIALPSYKKYIDQAKSLEAVSAMGSLYKSQMVAYYESSFFGHCTSNATPAMMSQWKEGDKFKSDGSCSNGVVYPVAREAQTYFLIEAIPGKYSDTNTLDPNIPAAENFPTNDNMFDLTSGGAGACPGFGSGVLSMTGVDLGLEGNPSGGYAYYVAYAQANFGGSATLIGEGCSLVFQIVEFAGLNGQGVAASPIVTYTYGD